MRTFHLKALHTRKRKLEENTKITKFTTTNNKDVNEIFERERERED